MDPARYYTLNFPKRTASFAIMTIDSYLGQPAANDNIRVYIEGINARPVVKAEGYYVFTDLAPGEYQVIITAKTYYAKTLPVNHQAGQCEIIKTFLIPNRSYRCGSEAVRLSCHIEPNTLVYVAPKDNNSGIKIVNYKETDGKFFLKAVADYQLNLANKWFAAAAEEFTYFAVVEKLDPGVYELNASLQTIYQKGMGLVPLSLGQSDETGYLTMPVWGLGEKRKELRMFIPGKMPADKPYKSFIYGANQRYRENT